MDMYLASAVLGVVEGVTEFLPISSTGHLILVNQFIGFESASFEKMFDIVIQLGAILAVVVHFRHRLMPVKALRDVEVRHEMLDVWFKSAIGVVPALIVGLLYMKLHLEDRLFNPFVVSTALVFGGIAIVAIESWGRKPSFESIGQMSYKIVIAIGFFQCIAMIPGTSRSAATIIGAMLLGASRPAAAEFSFFLAVPTMCAATGASLLKHFSSLSPAEWTAVGIGFTVSFFVAWGVIALFMKYIQTRDFKPFGYYRMVLGIAVVAFFLLTGRHAEHKDAHRTTFEAKAAIVQPPSQAK